MTKPVSEMRQCVRCGIERPGTKPLCQRCAAGLARKRLQPAMNPVRFVDPDFDQ